MPYISKKRLEAYEKVKEYAMYFFIDARDSLIRPKKCRHGQEVYRTWYCDYCHWDLVVALEKAGVPCEVLDSCDGL